MHPVQHVCAFIVETLRPESEAISEREVLIKGQYGDLYKRSLTLWGHRFFTLMLFLALKMLFYTWFFLFLYKNSISICI